MTGSHDTADAALARLRADEYPQLDRVACLNTAAESVFMRSHAGALPRYTEAKALGSAGRDAMYEAERRCRALAAELLGVGEDEIAFVSSAPAVSTR